MGREKKRREEEEMRRLLLSFTLTVRSVALVSVHWNLAVLRGKVRCHWCLLWLTPRWKEAPTKLPELLLAGNLVPGDQPSGGSEIGSELACLELAQKQDLCR